MTTLEFIAYLAALVFGAPLLGWLLLVAFAPAGYEDSDGYHPGRPDSEVRS